MPRIAIVDTAYPAFLAELPPVRDYESGQLHLLAQCFGTSNFYSRYLDDWEGWETLDIMANYEELQRSWSPEFRTANISAIALQQIYQFKPDVVFMQDFSFFDAATLRSLSEQYLLAGQCSCPMPKAENVAKFACIFTSFPHYVGEFRRKGVPRVEYMPLAFEASLAPLAQPVRNLDIVFVGGVGVSSHWRRGTHTLEKVAERFGERFHWYGYGIERLSQGSPLRSCWKGQAWGRQMYELYGKAKIVINRHGEVASGYANNLRLFEATGMGALMVTEYAPNVHQLFPAHTLRTYEDADDLCRILLYYLENDGEREAIAASGQRHTLANHNYGLRMKTVSRVLSECLKGQVSAQHG